MTTPTPDPLIGTCPPLNSEWSSALTGPALKVEPSPNPPPSQILGTHSLSGSGCDGLPAGKGYRVVATGPEEEEKLKPRWRRVRGKGRGEGKRLSLTLGTASFLSTLLFPELQEAGRELDTGAETLFHRESHKPFP